MSGTPEPPREWDAASYDRVCAPQLAWARSVIARLGLSGDEVVLDAGCGSGRVTELLVAALPEGRVIGVDASAAMIVRARERLGGRVELREADLLALELEEPVDAVFSNAVFHWITDQVTLFGRLASALGPGGRLEAQCGGKGNIAAFRHAAEELIGEPSWSQWFEDWRRPWRFDDPSKAEADLRAAGFAEARCWLEPSPAEPQDPADYVRTVCGGPYLERIPAAQRDRFLCELLERLPKPIVLEYVRLNLSARRAGRLDRV